MINAAWVNKGRWEIPNSCFTRSGQVNSDIPYPWFTSSGQVNSDIHYPCLLGQVRVNSDIHHHCLLGQVRVNSDIHHLLGKEGLRLNSDVPQSYLYGQGRINFSSDKSCNQHKHLSRDMQDAVLWLIWLIIK